MTHGFAKSLNSTYDGYPFPLLRPVPDLQSMLRTENFTLRYNNTDGEVWYNSKTVNLTSQSKYFDVKTVENPQTRLIWTQTRIYADERLSADMTQNMTEVQKQSLPFLGTHTIFPVCLNETSADLYISNQSIHFGSYYPYSTSFRILSYNDSSCGDWFKILQRQNESMKSMNVPWRDSFVRAKGTFQCVSQDVYQWVKFSISLLCFPILLYRHDPSLNSNIRAFLTLFFSLPQQSTPSG